MADGWTFRAPDDFPYRYFRINLTTGAVSGSHDNKSFVPTKHKATPHGGDPAGTAAGLKIGKITTKKIKD